MKEKSLKQIKLKTFFVTIWQRKPLIIYAIYAMALFDYIMANVVKLLNKILQLTRRKQIL